MLHESSLEHDPGFQRVLAEIKELNVDYVNSMVSNEKSFTFEFKGFSHKIMTLSVIQEIPPAGDFHETVFPGVRLDSLSILYHQSC